MGNGGGGGGPVAEPGGVTGDRKGCWDCGLVLRSAPGAEKGPGALKGDVSIDMGNIWCGALKGLIKGTEDVEEASET